MSEKQKAPPIEKQEASPMFELRNAIHILVLENMGELDECEMAIVEAFNNLVGDMLLPINVEDYL